MATVRMVVVGGGGDGREVEVVVISMSGGFRILTSGLVRVPALGFGCCPTTQRGASLFNPAMVHHGSEHVVVTSIELKLGKPVLGGTPVAANTVFRNDLVSKVWRKGVIELDTSGSRAWCVTRRTQPWSTVLRC